MHRKGSWHVSCNLKEGRCHDGGKDRSRKIKSSKPARAMYWEKGEKEEGRQTDKLWETAREEYSMADRTSRNEPSTGLNLMCQRSQEQVQVACAASALALSYFLLSAFVLSAEPDNAVKSLAQIPLSAWICGSPVSKAFTSLPSPGHCSADNTHFNLTEVTCWILMMKSRWHKAACSPTIHLPDAQGFPKLSQNDYSEGWDSHASPLSFIPSQRLETLRMHKSASIQPRAILGSDSWQHFPFSNAARFSFLIIGFLY